MGGGGDEISNRKSASASNSQEFSFSPPNELSLVRTFPKLILLCSMSAAACSGQNAPTSSSESIALVEKALATELSAAQDTSHPMRYLLRKSSPRLTTIKEMIETHDGSVALLLSVDDKPCSDDDAAKEQARLQGLLDDPGKQHHRKQVQEQDTARALKVLRVLPTAFLYTFAGQGMDGQTQVEKFAFTPNPKFDPPDLETEILTALTGEIWVDPAHGRVTHLEGHLQHDVDFGWGVLGRLNKGGWITIEQADVGGDQWRIVRFQMSMNGRVLFKTRNFVRSLPWRR
jgi:hypothetical protein